MSLTESNNIALGSLAPEFSLPNVVTAAPITFAEAAGEQMTLVVFMCNHCPFVVHVLDQIIAIANDYTTKGVNCIAISSNDVVTHPDDSPELMKKLAEEKDFTFPYLYDETQEVAKAYGAACTPDFFLYNSSNELVYHGQLDDSRPGNGAAVTGEDVRLALDSYLEDETLLEQQTPSIGCNIKWK